MRTLPLLLAAAVTACGLRPGGVEKAPAVPAMIMEWNGQTCGVDKPSTRVIRTQEEWLALWRDIGEPPPDAGFPARTAVAVFLGLKPTGGYGVTLGDPHPTPDGSLLIEFETTTPAGFAIQMLTQPYSVRTLEKTAAPIIIRAAAS